MSSALQRFSAAILLAVPFASLAPALRAQPANQPAPAPPGRTEHLPIHTAAIKGDIDAIRKELESGVHVDIPVRGGDEWHQGSTALMWAARAGTVEAVEFLLAQGARANLGALDGTTALMLAMAAKDNVLERVAALVKAGADVNASRWDGGTPLIWAASFCSAPGVIPALVEAGAKVEARRPRDGTTALMIAARTGNPIAVAELARAGADLKAVSNEGFTPLHWAARGERSNAPTILAVLDAGSEIDPRTKEGSTPLMLAALRGEPERVRALIDRGADVRAVNARGDTALLAAAQGGSANAVRSLLDAGADVNAANADGITALCLAVVKGEPRSVRLLVARGADVNARTKAGWTPLLLSKNAAVAEPLIRAGAEVNFRAAEAPNTAWTPLMFAASEGDLLTLRMLLNSGADPALTDLVGFDALTLAAHRSDEAGERAARILMAAMGIEVEPEPAGPGEVVGPR